MKTNFNKKLIAMGLVATLPLGLYADNTVKINGTSFAGTVACTYSSFSVDAVGVLTLDLSSSACLAADDGGDHVAPVIILNGASSVDLTVGDTYVELGATATDNVDGSIAVGAPTGGVNTDVADTYTLTYTATDAAGNTATKTRSVIVASSNGGGGGGSNNIADLTADILDPDREAEYLVNQPYTSVESLFTRAIINESGEDRNLHIVNMGDGLTTALPSAMNGINVQLTRNWLGAIKSDLYAVRIKTSSTFTGGRISIQNMEFGGSRTKPAVGRYTISETPGSMVATNSTGKCSTTSNSDSMGLMSEEDAEGLPGYWLISTCVLKKDTMYYLNAELAVPASSCSSRSEHCNLYFEVNID